MRGTLQFQIEFRSPHRVAFPVKVHRQKFHGKIQTPSSRLQYPYHEHSAIGLIPAPGPLSLNRESQLQISIW